MQIEREDLLLYYKGKKVLITGHTGFKGSWLSLILQMAGADVTGYALEPNTEPALFELAGISDGMTSVIGDIRDLEHLRHVFERYQPEYVFHLAAQPIVRESYRSPVDTYSTNVMGTVNVLECVRHCDSVRSVLNVTTDKVYLNQEQEDGYREEDKLDGYDPYSNSKSCSELVTHSYTKSFLADRGVRVSTARAGNVIGGGDFEKDRILPDCVRAALAGEQVIVRNPDSVRPYQHVLESLYVYLMIAACQHEDASVQGAYNVGPDEADCWTTQKLVDYFCRIWGNGFSWRQGGEKGVHEASLLKLNCEKLKDTFSWKPQWGIRMAVDKVVEWTRVYRKKGDIRACMEQQIREYMSKEFL
jgi:CDP-glucose 4,6-dehydratase